MRTGAERAHGAIVALALTGAACSGAATPSSSPPSPSAETLYLTDAAARRAELVASLVNPDNGYSELRLAHYDTGDAADWSRLPESNPRVEVIAANELDAPGGVAVGGPVSASAHSIAIDPAALEGDLPTLVRLGEDAFFHYPVQVSLAAETATVSRDAFAEYGFWTDGTQGAGGLVRQETPGGHSVLAFTCSTCHAASRGGALVVGVGNDKLDIGRLTVDASANEDPASAAPFLAWGPGRLDVTTSQGTEPVRIADLRPVQWLGYLQADATVEKRDLVSLAIRIETLIITSHNQNDRPSRAITLGLAAYVSSLGSSLVEPSPSTPEQARGESLFQTTCTGCHLPPALTGPPVALATVGTDPTVGLSANRGTGMYRVPSLHGVGSRGPLLHNASLPDLAAMFDPERLSPSYTGGRLGPGSVQGHPFGLSLGETDRADLISYLQTL